MLQLTQNTGVCQKSLSPNTFPHLHLKLPFYGIRGRFNVTLRRKNRKCNAWKNSPFIQWEEVAGTVLYMVGLEPLRLERNNPKPSCEVTKCLMDTVLLKIIFCMTATLQLFLQYSLRTDREDIIQTDCVSHPNAKQALHILVTMYKLSPMLRAHCQDCFSLS